MVHHLLTSKKLINYLSYIMNHKRPPPDLQYHNRVVLYLSNPPKFSLDNTSRCVDTKKLSTEATEDDVSLHPSQPLILEIYTSISSKILKPTPLIKKITSLSTIFISTVEIMSLAISNTCFSFVSISISINFKISKLSPN